MELMVQWELQVFLVNQVMFHYNSSWNINNHFFVEFISIHFFKSSHIFEKKYIVKLEICWKNYVALCILKKNIKEDWLNYLNDIYKNNISHFNIFITELCINHKQNLNEVFVWNLANIFSIPSKFNIQLKLILFFLK